MKKNGTTSKGTTRWRCKAPTCGVSTVQPRAHTDARRHFQLFIDWITDTSTLTALATRQKVTRRTLTRWFRDFWFIQVPDNTDHQRIYDQIFIDGTYFHKKCLLVASTMNHVVAWRWCVTEDAFNYGKLLDQLPAPHVVTTDGQRGALKAIKKHWPQAKVQRCIVHVKRNIQQYVTLRPNTPAGKALRTLSLELLKVTTQEQAATWAVHLHNLDNVFHDWLNEKTYRSDVAERDIPTFARNNKTWWYTHYRQRTAYRLLERLYKAGQLFVYVDPPKDCDPLVATTNSLEGGINAQLKNLARAHRGTPDEHQRVIMDWWLYLHTEHPDEPHAIAAQQRYGADGRDIADGLIQAEHQLAHGHEDGRPATYDTGIEVTPTPSQGIRKGWAGRS